MISRLQIANSYHQLDDRYFTGLEGQYTYELHFLLKEQSAPSSDYICRVRPVHEWENRSVSAEVYLEPGKYEILPKITATRDTETPTMEKLVKQFAEKNPQKLRQVGMQYDLAHAKGGIPDEDRNVLERKEKEKHKKKKTPSTTVKVEVEIDIPKSSEPVKIEDSDGRKSTQEGEAEQFEDAAEILDSDGAKRDGVKRNPEIRPKATPALPGKDGGIKSEAAGAGSPDPTTHERVTRDEVQEDGKKDDKRNEDDKRKDEPESDDSTDSEEDGDDSRWNAVCVTCLRVYSQDSDLTISLEQPETSGQELSSSLVQGQEPAGATQ